MDGQKVNQKELRKDKEGKDIKKGKSVTNENRKKKRKKCKKREREEECKKEGWDAEQETGYLIRQMVVEMCKDLRKN